MNGASGDVAGIFDDDPMCMQTTVSVSSHAAKNGSQLAGVDRRQPERVGVLGEGDGVAALGGAAAHLVGGELGVPQRDHGERDEPALAASPAHHSSIIQSL